MINFSIIFFVFDNNTFLVQSFQMDKFNISPIPELIFGPGTLAKLPDQIEKNNYKNIVIITGGNSFVSSSEWKKLKQSLDVSGVKFVHYKSSGETSPETVDNIIIDLKSIAVDAVIAIGGGTVMDTGKAVAAMLCMPGSIVDYLEGVGTKEPSGRRKPLICVPTTSGTGSEATKNAVITKIGKDGFKKSLRHKAYIPDLVIIDPELIVSCPKDLSLATGMDAVTQLLESYVSTQSSPFTDIITLKGLELAGKSLPLLSEDGSNIDVRSNMAYAAYLSGISLANAGLGVVHGAASVLGSIRSIPHGVVCGTLLGSATEKIISMLKKEDLSSKYLLKFAAAGTALTGMDLGSPVKNIDLLVKTLNYWVEAFNIPKFSEYGFTENDMEYAAKNTGLKNTPVKLTFKDIYSILISRL